MPQSGAMPEGEPPAKYRITHAKRTLSAVLQLGTGGLKKLPDARPIFFRPPFFLYWVYISNATIMFGFRIW